MPTFPAGSLVVPNDLSTQAAVFDDDGNILGLPEMSRCEMGDILASGLMALGTIDNATHMTSIDLYDDDFSLVVSVPLSTLFGSGTFDGFSPIRGQSNDRFYIAKNKFSSSPMEVTTILPDGTPGPTTWTLPFSNQFIRSMTADLTNTILYYTLKNAVGGVASFPTDVWAYNLMTDTDLGVIIPEDTLAQGLDMYVAANGDLIIMYGVQVGPYEVRRYSPAGVLQMTYPLSATAGDASPVYLALQAGAPDVLWARSFIPPFGNVSQYDRFSLSAGTIQDTFDLANVGGGGAVPLSCPLFVTPIGESPICPGEVTTPRIDGLPYTPPVIPPCSGTGQRGAPRTGAQHRTLSRIPPARRAA